MTRNAAIVLTRLAALAVLMGATSALIFGYLGWLHPAFDSFSHFRVHVALALMAYAPVLLALRFRPEALFAMVLGIMAVVQTTGLTLSSGASIVNASPTQAGGDGGLYRLLHMNLRYDNQTPQAALSLIGELRPDIVTLNEVSEQWLTRLAVLDAAYPYLLVCQSARHIGGVAILSRRPFSPGTSECDADGSMARVHIDIGGRVFDVATLHLGWPWPFGQHRQIAYLARQLGAIGPTAIIAGDLNAAPWSEAARQVETAANARLLRGIGPTWLDRRAPAWLRERAGLPIDNIMVKGGVVPLRAGTIGDSGSDHLPVMLEFMLLPQERPAPLHQSIAQAGAK